MDEDLRFVSNTNGLQECWDEKLEFMLVDVLKSYKGIYGIHVKLTCPKKDCER